MILGLDISTTATGWCVLDGDVVVEYGAWDFGNKNKFPDLFTKAKFAKQKLDAMNIEYDIKSIFVEKSLQSFRSGFSSANTLSILSAFNGIISWLCYDEFGIVPQYLSAPSARKSIGITIEKKSKDTKQQIVNFLLATEPKFKPIYTKTGTFKPILFDMADSIVIAKAGAICEKKKSKS